MTESISLRAAFSVARKIGTVVALTLASLAMVGATAQAQTRLFHETFGAVVGQLPTATSNADGSYNRSACVNGLIRVDPAFPGYAGDTDGTAYLFHNTGNCAYSTANRIWFNAAPIAVEPNKTYRFVYQFYSRQPSSPAILIQRVTTNAGGSIAAGTVSTPTQVNGAWVERYMEFVTGPGTTSVTLGITNNRTTASGNDFGVDSLALYDVSPPSFGMCTSDMYMSQAPSTADPMTLLQFNTASNPFAYATLGSSATLYNATAFNPVGNYLYGINGSNLLVRIGSNGVVESLGAVQNLPAGNYNAGEIGPDGTYYVKPADGDLSRLYLINLATRTATLRTMTTAFNVADLAWHNGLLYAAVPAGSLMAINPTSGTVTAVGPTGAPSGHFGAMFGASNGLFGSHNSGGFYQFDTATGAGSLISNSPGANLNDGAKCVLSPLSFPADTGITKDDGSASYTAGTDVTYTMVVSNKGPFGVQNALVNDLLPAGITTASWTCGTPTQGGVCSAPSGNGSIANLPVNLPAGATITIKLTLSVPANFTGDLVNTATVTNPVSSPDPVPADNTATDTDKATTLTLLKSVVNSHGGTAVAGDFTLSAAGPKTISGTSGSAVVTNAAVPPGAYTLSEVPRTGYTGGDYSCVVNGLAPVSGNSLTLALGDTAVCTVTNTDQPALLTLVKTVANSNGGTAIAADFTLTATGPTPLLGLSGSAAVTGAAVVPGAYTLGENAEPGYGADPYSCSINGGIPVVGNSLSLSNGQNAVCTVTNRDQPARLTLVKRVINAHGGTAQTSDFTLTATGPVAISGLSGAAAITDVEISAGAYALSETSRPGYAAGTYSCVINGNAPIVSNALNIAVGDVAVCTVENRDTPATLTLKKVVANTNGGTATVANFTLTATGPVAVSGITGAASVTAAAVPVGSYVLRESNLAGYQASLYSCEINAAAAISSNTLTLANGDDAICTITNTDQPAQLTLIKTVTNDDGGLAAAGDFPLSAAGPVSITGVSGAPAVTNVTVPVGLYSLAETNLAGYAAAPFSCVIDGRAPVLANTLALAGGDTATCTIVNNDIAPAVTISKALVDESGPTPMAPDADELLTYEITLTNTGGTAYDYEVTDVLDPNVAFVSANLGGALAGGDVSWTGVTVPAQSGAVPGVLVLEIVVRVNSGIGGGTTVTNIAKQTGTVDPVCPSAQCVVIPSPPRVTIAKSLTSESGSSAGVAEPGETLTYKITLTNTGGATLYDLTDRLDPNTTFVSATLGGVPAGGVVNWTSLNVPAESGGMPGVLEVEVVATVIAPLPAGTGTISNIAFQTGGPEPTCPSEQCVQIPTPPVVSIVKTLISENGSVANRAEPGETLVYAITLTNTGGPATDFAVTDVLDPNVTLVSASDGGVLALPNVNWTGLSVPAQTATPGLRVLTVHVKVNSPLPTGVAEISNIAFETGQPEPICPSLQCVQLPTPPAVTIKKELTGESGTQTGAVEPGELLTYTITLTNTGGPANGFGVTDKLDGNIVAAVASHAGVVTPASIIWNNLTVPQQAGGIPGHLVLTVTTTVANPLPVGVSQVANLAYETGQPEPLCPSAQCVLLPSVPAITISKALTAESGSRAGVAEPGETLTYRITLTNTGGPATGYQVTDRLDANVTFANASDGGILAGSDVTWSGIAVPAQVGAIPGTKSVTVRTRVKDPLPPGATMVANLAFQTGTSVPACPSPQCVEVRTPPSVAVKKELTGESIDRNDIAQPGEVLDYTITLTNSGGDGFTNYRLTETVPVGATLTAVSGATGFVANVTGPATIDLVVPLIAASDEVLVTVSFTVSDPLPLGATAIVNALTGGDLPPGCLTCSVSTPTPARVAATKTLTAESVTTDSVAQPGELLTYTIALANSGGTDFTNFRLTEHIPLGATLTSVVGATGWTVPVAGPATLDLVVGSVPANGTALVIIVFTIDDPIANGLNSIANTISGGDLDPGCLTCTVTVPTASKVSIVKALTGESITSDAMAQPGETLTYTITLNNAGGAPFANYQFSENVPSGATLISITGATGLVGPVAGPAVVDLQVASVAPGSTTVTVDFRVDDPIADGITGIVNTISGGHIPPGCTTCSVTTPTAPKVSVIKDLTAESKAAETIAEPGEVLTYSVVLVNAGGTAFTNFRFTENVPAGATLTAVSGATGFGAPVAGPASLALVVPSIAAEGSATVSIDFTMDDPLPIGVAVVTNTVSDGDIPPFCLGCSVTIPLASPSLTIVKTGTIDDVDASGGPTPGDTLTYEFAVTNTGNVPLDGVVPIDGGPTFNGQSASNVLSAITPAPVLLAPTESETFTATYVLSQADLDNAAGIVDGVSNTAMAQGYRGGLMVPANRVDSANHLALLTLPSISPSDVTITKQAATRFVRIGDNVAYTVTVTNNGPTLASKLRVTDIAPSGFRYVEGSASVGGVAHTPLLDGRNIIFDNLTIGGNQQVEIRLEMTVLSSAGPGRHVNRAIAADADGSVLAPEATAAVEVTADPILACGDIIGRVFDDKNRDGYPDDGEPGLAGVRLATVGGILVTTDSNGRFHLPCAAMPDGRIGSNFILKLDERTLPTGYGVTSENPRVVRLTAGKMTSLNFGASIGRVVQLELSGDAFVPGGSELREEWESGLDQLIAVLGQEPSILQLTYLGPEAGRELARDRMDRLEREIGLRWTAAGHQAALDIQTRVEAGR